MSNAEADAAAAVRDWPAYFRLMAEAKDQRGQEVVEQPAPEHTTRNPWPDDFVAPPVVVKLRVLAESLGWEVRMGYSRAYLKEGRGHVRRNGSGAVWALNDLVQVGVRRPSGTGRADAWIIYRRSLAGRWAFYEAMAGGASANVGEWKTFVNAGAGAYADGSHDPI